MAGQFEVFGDGGLFRFRLTGQDNEVLALSGVYATKGEAAAAIMAVREFAATGHIVDRTIVPAAAGPASALRRGGVGGRSAAAVQAAA